MFGKAEALVYTSSGMPRLMLRNHAGELDSLDAGFVAIAIGINSHTGHDYRDDALITSIKRLKSASSPCYISSTRG
jgi:hypothetical protein